MAKAKQSDKSEVTVTWNGGARVFSLETHGADFEALAEQFAAKHNGEVA